MVDASPIYYAVAQEIGELNPQDVQEISEAHHACSPRINEPKPSNGVSVVSRYHDGDSLAFDSDDLRVVGDETRAQVLERFAESAEPVLCCGEVPCFCGQIKDTRAVTDHERRLKKAFGG